jgi:hypothetical protein
MSSTAEPVKDIVQFRNIYQGGKVVSVCRKIEENHNFIQRNVLGTIWFRQIFFRAAAGRSIHLAVHPMTIILHIPHI